MYCLGASQPQVCIDPSCQQVGESPVAGQIPPRTSSLQRGGLNIIVNIYLSTANCYVVSMQTMMRCDAVFLKTKSVSLKPGTSQLTSVPQE